MTQIPGEQVFGTANGRNRDVQGIIRNSVRDQASSKQERGEPLHGIRDLQEVAICDE